MIYIQLAAPTIALAAFLLAMVLFLRDRRPVSLVLPLLAVALFLDSLTTALPVQFHGVYLLEGILHLLLASLALGALALMWHLGQQRETEQRVRVANEARTAAILEAAVDPVLLIDGRGIVQLANPAVEKLLGHRPAEIIGKNVSILMHPDESARHDGYLETYLRTRQAHIIGIGREVSARHRDGRAVPVHLSVSALEVDGELFFAGTLHDLTALRAKTAELEESHEALGRVSQEIMRVQEDERNRISREIHDVLGQALVALKFQVQNAIAEPKSMEDLQEACAGITAYINQILKDARELSHSLSPIALRRLGLNRAIQELTGSLATAHQIVIETDVDHIEHFFPENWDINVYRIVQEALLNALKHADASRIQVFARKTKDRLSIHIRDDGVGLEISRASRADSESERPSGLGLLIMQQRAALVGGRLEVLSIPPGTEVHFELDRAGYRGRRPSA